MSFKNSFEIMLSCQALQPFHTENTTLTWPQFPFNTSIGYRTLIVHYHKSTAANLKIVFHEGQVPANACESVTSTAFKCLVRSKKIIYWSFVLVYAFDFQGLIKPRFSVTNFHVENWWHVERLNDSSIQLCSYNDKGTLATRAMPQVRILREGFNQIMCWFTCMSSYAKWNIVHVEIGREWCSGWEWLLWQNQQISYLTSS